MSKMEPVAAQNQPPPPAEQPKTRPVIAYGLERVGAHWVVVEVELVAEGPPAIKRSEAKPLPVQLGWVKNALVSTAIASDASRMLRVKPVELPKPVAEVKGKLPAPRPGDPGVALLDQEAVKKRRLRAGQWIRVVDGQRAALAYLDFVAGELVGMVRA